MFGALLRLGGENSAEKAGISMNLHGNKDLTKNEYCNILIIGFNRILPTERGDINEENDCCDYLLDACMRLLADFFRLQARRNRRFL